ncbi:hypothetical protein CWI36_0467p0020 [Hamiltosporidium magnivora]|uniref:Uncharacterized protein n=1 Tax=Hamiltosporidium magnivora TaxID=148818 RepID=A0A4Q9LED2_9MICR|nr:hypothetical protein CWI36_0467p0020 [Hamiltosporidium magnivora]
MKSEAKEFLKVIGLKTNNEKSATIDTCYEDTVTLLEGFSVINKIHLCLGCKERLYLSRTKLGRGLHSVELRSEHMLLQLLDCLEKSKEISTRRAAILVENNYKTHLALIKGFLKVKYRLVEEITKKSLEEAQLEKLYNEIEKRKHHLKLYNARKNELRQNEVVGFLHLLLLNRYKFKSSKRIRSHSVQKTLDNENAEIRFNTRIKTDVKTRNNRPDIFILDKKKYKTTPIKNYDFLANEFGFAYKCSVEIIPYVMTWVGIVAKYHISHLKRPEIPMNVEAYIQSIVLKKTVETISLDRRRGNEASIDVIIGAQRDWEPTPSLNKAKREQDGGTTFGEPINNINEELDLEKEK